MSRKLIIKIVVDLCMTVLILLLMSYSLVGEVVHEWLGMAMLVFLILHGALNAGWIRGLRKGRYSAFRIVQTASAAFVHAGFYAQRYRTVPVCLCVSAPS